MTLRNLLVIYCGQYFFREMVYLAAFGEQKQIPEKSQENYNPQKIVFL